MNKNGFKSKKTILYYPWVYGEPISALETLKIITEGLVF